jgi:hypothetical protein
LRKSAPSVRQGSTAGFCYAVGRLLHRLFARNIEVATALSVYGVKEFTFKHTYVAYGRSVYGGSPQDMWARQNRVATDPFNGRGEVIGALPWGPEIRRIDGATVCFYYEPDPDWEKENRLCRSINLLSDSSVYASLEDHQSLLYRLN